jgi:hypothetical protein
MLKVDKIKKLEQDIEKLNKFLEYEPARRSTLINHINFSKKWVSKKKKLDKKMRALNLLTNPEAATSPMSLFLIVAGFGLLAYLAIPKSQL